QILPVVLAAPLLAAQTPHDDPVEESEAPPPAPVATSPLSHPNFPTEGGMIRVPGGRFTMGSADRDAAPNERPPHPVTVAPFWIDRTEVTVEASRSCVRRRACAAPARSSLACTYDLGDPELPVSCVHWRDADAYCRFVAKRLPRETEWE